MDVHYWLFPWLSLFASFIAGVAALFLGRRNSSPDTIPPISPLLVVVWIGATALLIAGGLLLGGWASIDYIPARGVIAGALGGAILVACLRQRTGSNSTKTAALFGFSTALICITRLWLTHGEVSGLIATVFSASVTLICFTVSPNIDSDAAGPIRAATLTTIYLTSLASAVLLGFTRAGTLGQLYWADVPLMVGAALTVGLLFAAAFDRFWPIAKALLVLATSLAVVIPLGQCVMHSKPFIGVIVLGIAAVALPLALQRRDNRSPLPIYLGFVLIIAAITVAFTLLSGYGLAILALGTVVAAAIAMSAGIEVPTPWMVFTTLLLLYRLEILQNGSSVRAIGPADIWDLLAIALGIVLPRIVQAWIDSDVPRRAWSTAALWLLAIAAPTIVLDYIWQPRSLTGLFLGLAVGQLSASSTTSKADIGALTATVAGLLLFLFLPGLDELAAPTRSVRIISVVVLSAIVIVKIVLSGRHTAANTKVA